MTKLEFVAGFLLNTVSATLPPIPRAMNDAPDTAHDQSSVDVAVYRSDNPDDANLGYVSEGNVTKNPAVRDMEKSKEPTVIDP